MLSLFPVPDKEKNHHAYMVHVLALLWTGILCGIVSLGFILLPHLWLRWVTLVPACLFIGLFTLFMNHKGFTSEASWLLPFMLWGICFLSALTGGGILGTSIFMLMAIILTAGFLLGWQGGVAYGVLSIAGTFALAYMETAGVLPADEVQHTPITRWVSYLIPFGTVVGLQYYFTNHLRSSLSSMQREILVRETLEKEREKALYDFNERVKELKTLYAVSRILQDEKAPLENIMKEVAQALPAGWQYPEITAARVCLAGTEFATANFRQSEFYLQSEMKTYKGTKVGVEVVYLAQKPRADEGPFLKEERSLITMLVEMLKIYLERRERTTELLEYKFALDEAAIVSIADVNAAFTHVNDNFCKVTGYSRAELLGKHHSMIWSGFHPPEYFKDLKAAMQSGEPYTGEFCNKAKDGTLYWTDTTIVPFLDEEGNVYQYLSINYNITERKNAELSVQESEEKYRYLFEHNPAYIIIWDLEALCVLEINKAVIDRYGYTREEWKGMSVFHYRPAEDHERIRAFAKSMLEGNEPMAHMAWRHLAKNGEEMQMEITSHKMTYNGRKCILSLGRDVTEERKAQEEVRLTAERLKRIMRSSPVAMALTKANNEIEIFNEQFTTTFGYTIEDVPTTEQWWQLAYPNEEYRMTTRTEWLARVEQTKAGNVFQPMEATVRCKDGTQRIVEFNYVHLGNEYVVTFHDITELRKGQEQLKNSEEKNRALIENISDAIVLIDDKENISFQSPSVVRVTGYSFEDRNTYKAFEFVHPHDIADFRKFLKKVYDSPGYPLHNQYRYIHKNGQVIWLEGTMVNMLNNESIKGVVVNYRDVTERKKFDEQQSLITSIVNSSDDAILSKTLDGRITTWNKGAEKLFGYPAGEIIGKNVTTLIPHHLLFEESEIISRIKAGKPLEHYETTRLRKDGVTINVSLTVSPIYDATGNIVGASAILRDITQRKKAEQEIVALNESLELKVEQRTAELQEANRMLESFSYSVSHDLRAPVRNISGFAQVLEKMMGSNVTPQQQEILHFIKDGANKMNQLINDLLEFSRADRQTVNAEKVNMNQLVNSIIKSLNTEAAKRTEFTVEELPEVNGDKALLQQVWVNLISNAVKYSSKKEKPQVKIWAELKDKETVFHIKDNGAGFDMKASEKLFGVFQRLHSANEFEGTGVGLSIVKRIVQKHGGNITAYATPGEGAQFSFSLSL